MSANRPINQEEYKPLSDFVELLIQCCSLYDIAYEKDKLENRVNVDYTLALTNALNATLSIDMISGDT